MMEGPCADSEEKREPAGDIDTVVVDGLKVLDYKRPIREADIGARNVRYALLNSSVTPLLCVCLVPIADIGVTDAEITPLKAASRTLYPCTFFSTIKLNTRSVTGQIATQIPNRSA
jgi:hypothetical protein